MHAVRRGGFRRTRQGKQVQAATVRSTIDNDNVAAVFVESVWRSPILDSQGNTHNHIARQIKGYKKHDPATKHKKATLPIVYRHILEMADNPQELAKAHLLCGVLFFAMRSCEYLWIS